jgi:hypothetical protein
MTFQYRSFQIISDFSNLEIFRLLILIVVCVNLASLTNRLLSCSKDSLASTLAFLRKAKKKNTHVTHILAAKSIVTGGPK